jgi:hypothetical protein
VGLDWRARKLYFEELEIAGEHEEAEVGVDVRLNGPGDSV